MKDRPDIDSARLAGEPSLSRDVLEAVPEWGIQQKRMIDALWAAVDRNLDRYIELEARVTLLEACDTTNTERIYELQERVAELAKLGKDTYAGVFVDIRSLEECVALLEEAMDTIEYQAQDPEPLPREGIDGGRD